MGIAEHRLGGGVPQDDSIGFDIADDDRLRHIPEESANPKILRLHSLCSIFSLAAEPSAWPPPLDFERCLDESP
jgi:hypothetical protein